MLIKKTTAIIKHYKTQTARNTAIPKDVVEMLELNDKDKLIWIISKNGNITIKKESAEDEV